MDETTEQRRMRQRREYVAEQDRVCSIIGWEALADLCPVSMYRVHFAMTGGDWHLNGIPLHLWDRAALGYDSKAPKQVKCCACGQSRPNPENPGPGAATSDLSGRLRQTMKREPWNRLKESQSLSTRIGALKHAARRAAEEWAEQKGACGRSSEADDR